MRLPALQVTEGVDFVVAGLPYDTGSTYRVGARFAPEAVRSASVLLRPYNPATGMMIGENGETGLSGVDWGDAPVVPGNVEETYGRIERFLDPLVGAGIVPVCLGGDHSVTLAELRVLARQYGPLALAHLDAHSDLWDEYFGQRYTHGTWLRRALEEGLLSEGHVIQVGLRGPLYDREDANMPLRMGVNPIGAAHLMAEGGRHVAAEILERVAGHPAFITIDLDFLDPAFAPGVGTPEVGGPSTAQALELIRGLAGAEIVGCDVVELAPPYDPAGITALAAANLIYESISLIGRRRS